MRYNIAYYLFLLYNLVIFRPVIPVIKDAVAHSFALSIHLATVHAIYGANHLDKELDNTSSDNNKKNNTVKTEEASEVYVPTGDCKYSFFSNPVEKIPGLQIPDKEILFFSVPAPPPKFS